MIIKYFIFVMLITTLQLQPSHAQSEDYEDISKILKEIALKHKVIILTNALNNIVNDYITAENCLIERYPNSRQQIISFRREVLNNYINIFSTLESDSFSKGMKNVQTMLLSRMSATSLGPQRQNLNSKLFICVRPRPAAIFINDTFLTIDDNVTFGITNGIYRISIKENNDEKCSYLIKIDFPVHVKRECNL